MRNRIIMNLTVKNDGRRSCEMKMISSVNKCVKCLDKNANSRRRTEDVKNVVYFQQP